MGVRGTGRNQWRISSATTVVTTKRIGSSKGSGPLELARTQEILTRFLPPAPCSVVDVGGGPGVYTLWLARAGYDVHLVELAPEHVEQARVASGAQKDHPVTSIQAGDARKLPQVDGSVDAVLLLARFIT